MSKKKAQEFGLGLNTTHKTLEYFMSKTTLANKPGYLDSHAQEILKMLNDGVRKKEIASHFNVSVQTFSNWMRRRDVRQISDGIEVKYVFGEKSQNFYEQNKQQILDWDRAGLSSREIAIRLGQTKSNSVGKYIALWKEEENA